jgi:hypothetical protein
MKPLTVVASHSLEPSFERLLLPLAESELVEQIVIVGQEGDRPKLPGPCFRAASPLSSHETLNLILSQIQTAYLLLLPGGQPVSIGSETLESLLQTVGSTGAGLVYSDFYDEGKHGKTLHPLNDYQAGSVRDDFDFGAVILYSVPAIREALVKYGDIPDAAFAGLYDLRLKVSVDHALHHLRAPLYAVAETDKPAPGGRLFAYVDPRNEAVQREMESVFTPHLKRIGAYLPPDSLKRLGAAEGSFPVEASVVIPVRNRKETIGDAVKSALSQETDFSFNTIVVDNHSTDGTTEVLSGLVRQHSALKHIIPKRTDLGIGGCWNEAIHSENCGRYAVQLDSDDLYSSSRTLQKMVDRIRRGNCAMVIGSYTLVDSGLKEIPPGLIDHREWTDENGHNNALRINGLGAPRGFNTGLMRRLGFLNVSYGEDYAAALRISREYRIDRIYESLYLCRRWSGNTDSNLAIEEANRNDAFKDRVRTEEISARRKIAESIGQRA